LQSRVSAYSAVINCLVADHVTDELPAFTFKQSELELPSNIKLTDPQFHVSTDVDLLIGAEFFWDLICIDQIKALDKHSILQETKLCWILAGSLADTNQSSIKVHSLYGIVTSNCKMN